MVKAADISRKIFFRSVDKRSREAMIDFLRNHFRYDTARSWNRSTSYACNMKIADLDLDCATIDRLFNLIRVPEFYDELRYLIANFNRAHDYLWQAAWNGRNGGYLVLYQGCREPTQYRSYCTKCGQKNYKSVAESGRRCGVCTEEARVDFNAPPMRVLVFPGLGVDQDDNFEEWSLDDLQRRTKLVQEFDQLADDIVSAAINIAWTREVREEIEFVPVSKLRLA